MITIRFRILTFLLRQIIYEVCNSLSAEPVLYSKSLCALWTWRGCEVQPCDKDEHCQKGSEVISLCSGTFDDKTFGFVLWKINCAPRKQAFPGQNCASWIYDSFGKESENLPWEIFKFTSSIRAHAFNLKKVNEFTACI